MALGEQIRQLDEQVAAAVRRALDDVRDELRSGLERAIGDLRDRLSEVSPDLPESFFTEETLRQLAEATAPASEEALAEAEARGRSTGGAALRAALAAVDQAGRQSEILQALVDRSEPFASRAAVLLLRPEGLVGWTARGFGGAGEGIRSASLPPQGDDWREVIQDGPPRPLGASRCAQLADQLGAPPPAEGVAIPMILRDRVSAVVYADRLDDGDPLDVASLQVLVYTTALALETLAMRDREATTTLLPAAPGPESAGEPAAEAEPAAEPAPSEPETAERLETSNAETGATAAAESAFQEPAREPAPEPPPEAPPGPAEAPVETSAEPPAEQEMTGLPEEAEGAEPSETTPSVEPVESVEEIQVEATEAEPRLEEVSLEGAPSLDESFDEEFDVELEDEEESDSAGTGSGAATESIPWRTDEGAAEEPQRPVESASADEAGAVAEPSGTATLEDRPEAGAVPPPVPEGAGRGEAAEESREEAAGEDETPEPPPSGGPIEPPPDVEGPGSAFAEKKADVAEAGDEAAHDEARRLARLLVSEIQLYNQEEVAEGRSKGDIYERLKEDIDRSRQLYEERVDPDIRESTDYFYQELVRQLGAGDAKALGI